MKKQIFLFILTCLLCMSASSQSLKHSVGLSMGYGIPFDNSIYIDFVEPDFDIWSTPLNNLSFCLIYEYALNDILKIGARLEYEKINFDSYYTDKTFANRLALGFQFLCTYPKTPLHAEMGGYLHVGRINSEEFDNPVLGFDNGLLFGPGFQIESIHFAILFQPCFGYYFISDGTGPESGLIMYPKTTGKVSYSF